MRVTQAESWLSEEAMVGGDPKRSLRDRREETIEAWVGKLEADWRTGAVTRGGYVLSEN